MQNLISAFILILSFPLLAQTHSEIIDLGEGGVNGISKNGQYVCGSNYPNPPFLWSESTGKVFLGNLIGEVFSVSDNGIVVGRFPDSTLIINGNESVVRAGYWANDQWNSFEGMPGVPPLDGQSFTHAYGINSEGNKAVGMVWHPNWRVEACYWSIPDTGIGLLGQSGAFNSRANAVSNDGSIIAGWDGIANGPDRRAFYWDPAPHFMGGFDPTYLVGESRGMNSDGSVIVGGSVWPFVWTASNGMKHIVADSSDYWTGEAVGISDNGIIVGYVDPGGFAYQSFIKKPGWSDILYLKNFIIDSLGITGYESWYFAFANAISADGNMIGITAYPPGSNLAHALILTINSNPVTTFQLSVDVSNGWNIVSIPGLNSPDQNVNTWWPLRDPIANVFKYSAGYQSVTDATPGVGYWMKQSGNNTYNTGDEWPASGIQIVTHKQLAVSSGWNLIGGYDDVVATNGLTTTPPGLISGPVYGYSAGYQVAANLEPGKGYWVKLSGAGVINLPTLLSKGTNDSKFFKESWGKIVITDASGKSFTLYAVSGEVDLNNYELPPTPPAGMFDIRFSSGRIAEDLSNAVQAIDMNGIQYPVNIKVINMNINLRDESGKEINAELKTGDNIFIVNEGIHKLLIVSTESTSPTTYELSQNYPNPFNPSTLISYSIPQSSIVNLSIFNIIGEKVVTLVNEVKAEGNHQVEFNATNLPSGIYIYKIEAGSFQSTKKMMLLK